MSEATDTNSSAAKAAKEALRFPITVLRGFCTRLAGSNCEKCATTCPYESIELTAEGPEIEADFCSRCGLCCGTCDAFVTERITMNDLLEKVRRLSAAEATAENSIEYEPVIFTCYDQIPEGFEVHPNVVVLPCIGAVAPEFWAAALEVNPSLEIYCDFSLCHECPTAGPSARAGFTSAVNQAEQWTCRPMGRAAELPEKTDVLSRFADATAGKQHLRDMATTLASEVQDVTSGKHRRRNSSVLNNFHARNEALRAKGHANNPAHRLHSPSSPEQPIKKLWPRLQLISTAVQEHPDIAPTVARELAQGNNSLCEHCYEPCFSHCPAGARALDEEGNVTVDPLLCIACGNCVLYCPTGAAYLTSTTGEIFLASQQDEA